MNAKAVKQRLAEKGVRQIDLVKKWKLQPATIHKLINRQFASKRLDKRLARVLGVTLDELRAQPGKVNSSTPR